MNPQNELQKDIVEFFTSRRFGSTNSERQALVHEAGLGELIPRIDFDGSSSVFFYGLVDLLTNYGTFLDGRSAIERLLQAAKTNVGVDGNQTLDDLVTRWQLLIQKRSLHVSEGDFPVTDISVGQAEQQDEDNEVPCIERDSLTPNMLVNLKGAAPGGAVQLDDCFYIERTADTLLTEHILQERAVTTIRAPRQTGKTSLLIRGAEFARRQGARIVLIDIQEFVDEELSSLDACLKTLAELICDRLELKDEALEQVWRGAQSPAFKLRRYMERHVLPRENTPLVLALDEADGLLGTDYYQDLFGMLRAWHTLSAHQAIWQRLRIVLVISTEPYLLIKDTFQSPFNIGLVINLPDFNEAQVRELNQLYGLLMTESELLDCMAMLNGHPFLTRQALFTMTSENLSWRELIRRVSEGTNPFDQHLTRLFWVLQHQKKLKQAFKEVIHTNRCSDEASLLRLMRAGLITGSGGSYACRCELYRLHFEHQL